jgi:hypothetical protein
MAPEDMASARRTTKVLRNPRNQTVAYARKQKPPGDGGDAGGTEGDAPDATIDEPMEAAEAADAPDAPAAPTTPTTATSAPVDGGSGEATSAPAVPATSAAATEASAAIEPPLRARTETIKMPVLGPIGAPPAMPEEAPPAPAAVRVDRPEAPTRMPGPQEIPGGNPDDPAAPPGFVPSGDSRSLRRRADVHEFALIYRIKTYVITRFGVVGTRGQWRVVEYPTSSAASHAYAKECSRFVSDGFSDYREWSGI